MKDHKKPVGLAVGLAPKKVFWKRENSKLFLKNTALYSYQSLLIFRRKNCPQGD